VTFVAPFTLGATCEARFFANNGYTKLATSATVTVTAGAGPSVTLSPSTVAQGGTLSATVSNGPANATDWVGLYCPSSSANGAFVAFRYLNNSTTAPGAGVATATVTFTAPAMPGATCHVRFFANNGYSKLATSPTVTVSP
jgi:hypothetical protein